VLAIWFIACIVRFLVADLAFALLAPGGVGLSLGQVIAGFVSVLGWMWLLSSYFALNDYYRASSNELRASMTRLLEITNRQLGDDERLRASLSASIEEAVLPTIGLLTREVSVLNDRSSQQELLALAERAGGEARLLVREISHGIAGGKFSVISSTGSIETAELMRNAREPWLVSVLWAPLLLAFSILPLAFANFGAGALLRVLVAFAAWFGVCVLLRLLQNGFSGLRLVKTFGFVLVANLLAIGAGMVATILVSPDWPFAKAALQVLGLCMAAILAGVTAASMTRAVSGLRKDGELLAEQNRLIVEATVKFEDSIGRLRRQVAQVLHGPVQGRLAAVALSLHLFVDGQRSGRVVSREETFRRCRALLEQVNIDIGVIMNGGPESIEPINSQLTKLAQRWTGLIDVEYTISSIARTSIDFSPALQRRVGSVIDEAINNAVTHGRAPSVFITVDSTPSHGIRIEALDNGKGVPAEVVPGFGLRDIEAVAGAWTLSPAPGRGALLAVTLSYLPMASAASIAERAAHA
jgi:signal transduction histidine kinase